MVIYKIVICFAKQTLLNVNPMKRFQFLFDLVMLTLLFAFLIAFIPSESKSNVKKVEKKEKKLSLMAEKENANVGPVMFNSN